MAKPLSMDLRKRMFEAVRAGASRHAAARQFAASPSCVVKLMQRFDRDGTIEARKFGGHRRPDLEAHHALIRALVDETPDMTIDELRQRLADKGIHTSRSPLGRCLLALQLTRKKRRGMPRSKPAPMSPPHARLGANTSRS